MKHVLITGGCGYVGTVLTQNLLGEGYRATVFDSQWFGNRLAAHPELKVVRGDIRRIETVPMDGIDVVLHLANVANDPCAELDSKLNWEINVLTTMFLVEKTIANGVPQFIFASSENVYGVKDEPEIT
ncbi:MAG TPA: NAD-dependent epimerase/dehydratase family protein, partial [Opitutaceae bacterium]